MSNPYEAPANLETTPTSDALPLPPPQPAGTVGQVRVVAVLMIVQGVLDGLMGLLLASMGIFMGTYFRQAMQDVQQDPNFQPGQGPSPDMMANIMGGTYAGLGLFLLAVGIVHMFAGYRNFQFKGRTLGIVSLVAGVLTIITFYCACTSIPLCIYGLIVYLNPSAANAFRMGDQGYSAEAILMTFSAQRYNQHVQSQPFTESSPFKQEP